MFNCLFLLAEISSSWLVPNLYCCMGLTSPRCRTCLDFMRLLSVHFCRLSWYLQVATLPSYVSQLRPLIPCHLQTCWRAFFPFIQPFNNDIKNHWFQNWLLRDDSGNQPPAGHCTTVHSPLITVVQPVFYWFCNLAIQSIFHHFACKNAMWKAFLKSKNIHCSPLTHWDSSVIIGGSEDGVSNHLPILHVSDRDIEKDLHHSISRDVVQVEQPVIPWNLLLFVLDGWCNICPFLVIGKLPSPQLPQHFKGDRK